MISKRTFIVPTAVRRGTFKILFATNVLPPKPLPTEHVIHTGTSASQKLIPINSGPRPRSLP